MTSRGAPVAVAAVPLGERAVGPDLARGAALLGIALANTVGWMYGGAWTALVKQRDAGALDRAVDAAMSLLVDNRGFPLFAMLFGYGIGVLLRRGRERGETPGRFRRRMLRRHLVLLGIGLAHGVLLFAGDIVASYAVIGMLAVLFADRRRILVIAAALLASPMLAMWGWLDGTIGPAGGGRLPDVEAATYADSVMIRAQEVGVDLMLLPATDLGLLTPMLIGVLLARVRLLEDVARHRALLRRLWRTLLPISLLGALPLTLVLVLDPRAEHLGSETLRGILGVVHQLSGLGGAVAGAALAALAAERLHGPIVAALAALGRMSLTGYVLQSVIALALFPAFTLGLGGRLGSAGASALMVLAWAAGLALAVVLDRAGRRGPLEHVLRSLAAPPPPRTTGGRG
ncbi:DUF418 domain-containing protein [Brachybacterium phenoliresistens]|uniref:DUF418 domain-containing protein n=1 Tax=Brachybacterium phenoliresistens TaxID=396014 RepID=UPI0031D75B14